MLSKFFSWVTEYFTQRDHGVEAAGKSRSSKWPEVRDAYLKAYPVCEICGRKDKLIVHHKVPFHIDSSKELDLENLMTLCEGDTVNCHLLFGHLLNWQKYNPLIEIDAAIWSAKLSWR